MSSEKETTSGWRLLSGGFILSGHLVDKEITPIQLKGVNYYLSKKIQGRIFMIGREI